MTTLKLGIRLESLGVPLRQGLLEAQRLGVAGVQIDAVGDLSPRTLTSTGRREFRNLLRAYNVELTALGCPLRHGLDVAEGQEPRIEHVRKVLTLAFELGPRVVVVQAGPVTEKPDDPSASRLTEALLALGQYGDRVGSSLALETGLESGETLAKYLTRFDCGSLGVNFDPANLLMNGFDPYESARALHGRIVHAHAKDARVVVANRTAREVPLGHGDLDWMRLLRELNEIDYHGWLTVEQEVGDNRLADVAAGVAILRRLLP